MSQTQHPSTAQVGKLINLTPVGLKEAALDSPTSRATAVHLTEQVDLIEKWLEEYLKATNRLISESVTLDNILNHFVSQSTLPTNISEAVLDHDYTVLAMRRYSAGAKDYWMSMISMLKRLTALVVDPIRSFLQNDLRLFKETRKNLDQTQKTFDSLQNKYASQVKSKEPSSLREDAFQLHEARKLYLKSSMDFFTLAPQLRNSFDKLLVRIFSDQWREMRMSRDSTAATFVRGAQDMERVRGWVREIENSEKTFRKELQNARKELEETAEMNARPSRELEDYSTTLGPNHAGPAQLNSSAPSAKSAKSGNEKPAEKQGWLYLRTYAGKPIRVVYLHRWAFVKKGVFGWLVQSARAGGVEESERIGVLLCNVRPAVTEERRFCFEVKTNKNAIMLQAETQAEMNEWIRVFESAKKKALEDPGATDSLAAGKQLQSDSAFAISMPPIAEFGTSILDSLNPNGGDEMSTTERGNTLPLPGSESGREAGEMPRRSTILDRDDNGRDPASRITKKLDLHRKPPASPQLSATPSTSTGGGGIASLIAASHGSMPVGPSIPVALNPKPDATKPKSTFTLALRDMPASSLAPSTLANPPAPTALSKAAVVVVGERGAAAGRRSGISNGMLANMWGSANWGFLNRLERGEVKIAQESKPFEQPSPLVLPDGSPPKRPTPLQIADNSNPATLSAMDLTIPLEKSISRTPSPSARHRSTISLDGDQAMHARAASVIPDFPNYYPLQLKTQDAQFRLLFPCVKVDERLVLVFRATWNPNDQQEFPGRVYVTMKEIYFYSHHLGLVLTSGVTLASIDEVTAAPGRDCDFLFVHLKEASDGGPSRITIKTFLEPLRLLQRRLNFLVRESVSEQPQSLEAVIKNLIKMEQEAPERSPSIESWEDLSFEPSAEDPTLRGRYRSMTSVTDLKSPVRVDRTLGHGYVHPAAGQKTSKFKLPAQPVVYVPSGNLHMAGERQFDVSPKALFHVLFGDKSAVWQLLLHERRAHDLKQSPWTSMGEGYLRRDFDFHVPIKSALGNQQDLDVKDYQVVDVNNDHLCYVVTDKRTAWYLPFKRNYRLVSKVVITHVAKSKCKLAVFIKVEWFQKPWLFTAIIQKFAMEDLDLDALDLIDLAADQVRKLGSHSRTKKAIQIFGQVGQSTTSTQLQVEKSTLSLELRSSPTQRSMLRLLLQSFSSFLETALTAVLEAIFAVLRLLWNACTANKLILAFLLISMLFNAIYTSRSSIDWWQERKASRYMGRLGVNPNQVMGKAVYLKDLEETLSDQGRLPQQDSSTCYSIFHDTYQLEDLNAPLFSTSVSAASTSQTSALRLQQTRQRLGVYRHDLLVAMRVVNSMDKEVIRSEWEQWVLLENRRCRQVESILQNPSENGTDGVIPDSLIGRGDEIGQWYNDYCASCKEEHESLAIV